MIKAKTIVAGLGVVAGLGTSLLPLATFAAEPNGAATATVEVTITSKISMSIDKTTVSRTMTANDFNEDSKSTLTVTANTAGYDITVKDNVANHKGELVKDGTAVDDAVNIKSIANATAPTAGSGTWGLKVGNNWYAIPANNAQANTIKTYTTGVASNDTTDVYYGFGTAPNQPTGTYSAEIVYEAIEHSA